MSASEEIKVKYCLLASGHSGITLVKMDECAKGFTNSLWKLVFMGLCIIVQFIKKNPTRCNNVSELYYSIFI
jgi:hypothetical protein